MYQFALEIDYLRHSFPIVIKVHSADFQRQIVRYRGISQTVKTLSADAQRQLLGPTFDNWVSDEFLRASRPFLRA